MNTRRFGRTGWQVSDIGYGMWGMGGWTESDDAESVASLQRAVELGCNLFDTACAYGEGHSEQLLGDLVRGKRDTRLYVATKIPPKNEKWPARPEYRLDDRVKPAASHAALAAVDKAGLDSSGPAEGSRLISQYGRAYQASEGE